MSDRSDSSSSDDEKRPGKMRKPEKKSVKRKEESENEKEQNQNGEEEQTKEPSPKKKPKIGTISFTIFHWKLSDSLFSADLRYQQLYLDNLPCAEAYEKSYMHRDIVSHVAVTK